MSFRKSALPPVEECDAGKPCEVSADGAVSVFKDQPYAQQVSEINDCFTTGSQLALTNPHCTLTAGAGAGAGAGAASPLGTSAPAEMQTGTGTARANDESAPRHDAAPTTAPSRHTSPITTAAPTVLAHTGSTIPWGIALTAAAIIAIGLALTLYSRHHKKHDHTPQEYPTSPNP